MVNSNPKTPLAIPAAMRKSRRAAQTGQEQRKNGIIAQVLAVRVGTFPSKGRRQLKRFTSPS
jgi:hypothetical protein